MYVNENHMDKAKQYHRYSLLCSVTSVVFAVVALLVVAILLMVTQ